MRDIDSLLAEVTDGHVSLSGYLDDNEQALVNAIRTEIIALVAKTERADAVVTAAKSFQKVYKGFDTEDASIATSALFSALDAYDEGSTT